MTLPPTLPVVLVTLAWVFTLRSLYRLVLVIVETRRRHAEFNRRAAICDEAIARLGRTPVGGSEWECERQRVEGLMAWPEEML